MTHARLKLIWQSQYASRMWNSCCVAACLAQSGSCTSHAIEVTDADNNVLISLKADARHDLMHQNALCISSAVLTKNC